MFKKLPLSRAKQQAGLFTLAATVLMTCLLLSCNKSKNIPDVDHLPAQAEIIRMEKEMYGGDTSQIAAKALSISENYPEFTKIYADIMRDPSWKEDSEVQVLEKLMAGPQMRMLYDTCMVVHAEIRDFEKELGRAMQFYQYYFPGKKIPTVYTCLTEFAYQAFTYGDDMIVLGTEHFMGKNFPAYNSIFPRYQSRFFTPEYMTAATMEVLSGALVGDNTGNRMADEIIHQGKKLYVLEQLMPETHDTILMKYTKEQLDWVEENEVPIYAFFINEDLMFSTDSRKFQKYIFPGPTSPGMPQDSPGRTACWMGRQIIRKYMKKNPQVTLEDLLAIKDTQKILNGAGYRGSLENR